MYQKSPPISIQIGFELIALTSFLKSCALLENPHPSPLYIDSLTIHPSPGVGKAVTLSVKVINEYEDLSDIQIELAMPEGVRLVKGERVFHASMKAGDQWTHDYQVCVAKEGGHHLFVSLVSQIGKDRYWMDFKTLEICL
jgi:hypothetical protein